ncbi:DNA polymerase III subunit beta [Aureimonas sp. ME7]|uniref:DNA polymerase III subunit beta n=1 Tax=Aureimonas sp. ME7 TaxID=2744252 RepID=UPI0015FB4C06|nr:DNA polymerase III subunit beta [Aureimonas sp. ME7]
MAVAFTVPQDVLLRLVSGLDRVVEKRNTIPILSNVLLTVNGDGSLSVEGTDLDIAVRMEAEPGTATVETPGSTTVPAGLLRDILKKLGKTDVRFRSDERFATLSAGRARFNLNELPASDYPDIAGIPGEATEFKLWPGALTRILDEVGFAISTEETRYYLNGVYFHGVGETERELATVATDGHRLSKLVQNVDGDLSAMAGIIVPRKTVSLFRSMADWCPDGEQIAVRCDASKITFAATGFQLISKLIDGTYPDYGRVIPSGNDNTFDVKPDALRAAVDRVSTVSAERGRAVKFALAGSTLTLTVQSPDAGTASDEIEIDGAPSELEIGFNAKYVGDMLATFESAALRFALADPGAPALITNPADDARLVVLMPMRV